MKVDDIKDKELRDAVQHLRYISSMTSNTPTMALVNKSAIEIVVDSLLRLIDGSTPAAEVRDFDKLLDFASNNVTELEMQVMTLRDAIMNCIKTMEITSLVCKNVGEYGTERHLKIQIETVREDLKQLISRGK